MSTSLIIKINTVQYNYPFHDEVHTTHIPHKDGSISYFATWTVVNVIWTKHTKSEFKLTEEHTKF